MNRFLFVGLMITICAASLFMVVESGEYYSTFYNNSYQGYWAALLVEVFLAISALLSFANKPMLNFGIKMVMVPLFLVIVGGASLKIVSPLMQQLAASKKQQKLVDFLEEQNQQTKVHLALLEGQKTNTAITLKHQRVISKKLINELKNQSSMPWMIWIMILFSTFLRFSIQLGNQIFAHSLGVLWRANQNPNMRNNEISTPKREIVKRWKVKHLRRDQMFVGILQFSDGNFMSIMENKRKEYKTWTGAVQFFNNTKYQGKI